MTAKGHMLPISWDQDYAPDELALMMEPTRPVKDEITESIGFVLHEGRKQM